jgi:hypothetical protein
LEDLGVDGSIFKWIWLRIKTDGEVLYMRQWTFGSHNMRGISWLVEDLFASQEGLCFMELIS